MNNNIIVVGPAAENFTKKGEMPSVLSALKFFIVKGEQGNMMVLFCSYDPLKFHSHGAQFYMGKTDQEKITVCGGQQIIFDPLNKMIHIFEVSAYGWPVRSEVISFLEEAWPNCKLSFWDKAPEEMKETEVDFKAEDYVKILANLPAAKAHYKVLSF